MKVPVYLKSEGERSAVVVGLIELTPGECEHLGGIGRIYRRYTGRLEATVAALDGSGLDFASMDHDPRAAMPVQQVHLVLEDGPHGVPFATHSVPMTYYAEALAMWQQVALEQAVELVRVARNYVHSKTNPRYQPNTTMTGAQQVDGRVPELQPNGVTVMRDPTTGMAWSTDGTLLPKGWRWEDGLNAEAQGR